MSAMTDPTRAMLSIEQEIKGGRLQLNRCHYDPSMGAYADEVLGTTRFAYVRLDDQGVGAFANLVRTDPLHGLTCYQVGMAVPPRNRGKGYAKAIVELAIKEMAYGFGGTPLIEFYVEAIVGVDNAASNAVCRSVLSDKPENIVDGPTGEPALHYTRKVRTVRR